MAILLTHEGLRRCFPGAPAAILDAFVAKQSALQRVGVLESPRRLAYFFANLGHETAGFTIRNLTENTAYSHERVAEVWPNRYSSAAAVRAKFGYSPGWQLRMFDEIYGSRMGNRPGTRDGSRYIGRGGPQITGRDGYFEISRRTGLDLEAHPELATKPEHQPAIAAAFWEWKNLNLLADEQRFESVVKKWNGGLKGLADRRAWLTRLLPICEQMQQGAFLPEVKAPKRRSAESAAGTAGAAGAGGVVALGVQQGWSAEQIAVAVVVVVVITFVVIMIIKRKRKGA